MKKISINVESNSDQIMANGDRVIVFARNLDLVDEMIAWLFDNTKKRFVLLGTNTIYFESEEDALHFKIRWG